MLVILGELSGLGGATLVSLAATLETLVSLAATLVSGAATLGGSLGLAGVGDFFTCEEDSLS